MQVEFSAIEFHVIEAALQAYRVETKKAIEAKGQIPENNAVYNLIRNTELTVLAKHKD